MASRSLMALLVLLLAAVASAYYLPGVAPIDYKEGDSVELLVNALKSSHSIIPYDYYDSNFNFCKPDEGIKSSRSSLGSVLFGDRVFNSPFKLNMLKKATCVQLCTQTLKKTHVNFLIQRIQEKYLFNWLVDNLPAANRTVVGSGSRVYYTQGFDLGSKDDSGKSFSESHPALNNHYSIVVEYQEVATEGNSTYRVVGVIVYASSLARENDQLCQKNQNPFVLSHDQEINVTYTYDVHWKRGNVTWEVRWDNYIPSDDNKIHWFSLINSLVIVLFLTFMVAVVLLRALHKDIAKYNSDSVEDAQDDFGWKMVHGDVFRSPTFPLLLSVFVGNGVQILLMSFVTLVLALLGFLSPSIRGSLATVAIVFYVCFGFAAGYTSARLYKTLGGDAWKRCVVLTACLIPGILSTILLILNFFLIGAHSSAAVPFTTLLGLLGLWIFLSCPLCFVGSYLGFKKEKIAFPVRVNQIPRQIPPQSFYMTRLFSIIFGGILPFGAIFIEFYFIMNSIWFNRIYYVFGFLALVFVVLVITCSEVTILMCYFHLCAEDPRWWWRSFYTAGSSAFYLILYSIVYYASRLEVNNFVSLVLYFGYTLVVAILFFIFTGTVGFLACLWFVRKIYGAIRID